MRALATLYTMLRTAWIQTWQLQRRAAMSAETIRLMPMCPQVLICICS